MNERSLSDGVACGTTTEPDVVDLRHSLATCCSIQHDQVGQITWCFTVQATMSSHAQLVLDSKPVMIAKQVGNRVQRGRAGDQLNTSVENGLC